jgi:hypothetical protein
MTHRIRGSRKAMIWLAAALAAAMLLPGAAAARGFVAFGFGFPLGPPAYYYPPPAYYYPPPAYYAPPPPVYYYPPPSYAPSAAYSQGQTCREYQTTAIIEGRPQPSYGTACLQADGTWKIVR